MLGVSPVEGPSMACCLIGSRDRAYAAMVVRGCAWWANSWTRPNICPRFLWRDCLESPEACAKIGSSTVYY